MAKSVYRQNAAEYLSLAETLRCEKQRSLLLQFASEWVILADAAARRSKRRSVFSALHHLAANHLERAAA